MAIISHPSSNLKPEWITCIRNEAEQAEKQGSLTKAQLQLIYDQGWFQLFVPKKNPVFEMSLPQAVILEESLSWADGSLGWTVTLCSGAGWFVGFFEADLAKDVFADTKVCLGGSGAASGTAERTEKGYLINGRWKYATGAEHLSHFTANCVIKEDNRTVLNEKGEDLILPFVFKRDEVNLINDWNTIGLIATCSQSFEVKNLSVEPHRCFNLAPEALKISHPIYKYPFLQFAETTLAANISGMAIHFVDCCTHILDQRINGKKLNEAQQQFLEENLALAENNLSEVRSHFYQVVEESWRMLTREHLVPEVTLQELSMASRNLAATAHDIVNKLYPFCGLTAANPNSEINRVWRDIHTASQHSLLTLP